MAIDVTKLQPVNCFYEVEMGGLQRIYRYPQHPISLRVELDVTQTGTVEITLFDETGFIVEAHMWASGGKARLRWGYMHQGSEFSSPTYEMQLLSYRVIPGQNQFQYVIKGLINGEMVFSSESYNGTLHEVIEKFAAAYGYRLEVNPPISKKYLRGIDPSGKTTEIKDWEFRKPAHVPDSKWVTEIVRQYARSEDGVGAYNVIFATSPTGEKVMRIVRADSVDNRWRFIASHPDSNVLDWQPEIDVSLSAGFGSQELILQGIAEVTGNLTKITVNTENSDKYVPKVSGSGGSSFDSYVEVAEEAQEIYHNSENIPEGVANRGVRVRTGGNINPYMDISPIVNRVAMERITQTIKGTLVILGQPEVTSGYRCYLQYLYPASLQYAGARPPEHYSSGDYYINNAVHDMKLGSYVTTMQLSRDAVITPPKGE